MFKKKCKNLKDVLAPVEKVAGRIIRSYAKNVQEDAWMVGYLAYMEKKDIVEALKLWRRKARRDQKKILYFTSARPLKEDKEQLIQISKDYR
jgi:hypothetical protein